MGVHVVNQWRIGMTPLGPSEESKLKRSSCSRTALCSAVESQRFRVNIDKNHTLWRALEIIYMLLDIMYRLYAYPVDVCTIVSNDIRISSYFAFWLYAYACKNCKDVLHECIAMQYFIRWSIPKDWPRKCRKKHVINLPRPLQQTRGLSVSQESWCLYFSVVWCVIMSARIPPGDILATRTKNEIHCTPSSSSKQHV